MSAMRPSNEHFNFLGANADHRDQVSLRVDLAKTPTFELLQRLFYDLYAQRRQDPQYLFVAEQDHAALSHDVNTTFLGHRGLVGQFANEITGSLVHIVPLSGLKPGSVIVGFFE